MTPAQMALTAFSCYLVIVGAWWVVAAKNHE